jgi:hypothetical protein
LDTENNIIKKIVTRSNLIQPGNKVKFLTVLLKIRNVLKGILITSFYLDLVNTQPYVYDIIVTVYLTVSGKRDLYTEIQTVAEIDIKRLDFAFDESKGSTPKLQNDENYPIYVLLYFAQQA